jgi:lipoprotein-anchoring transpeptidase ErfK/SrfK
VLLVAMPQAGVATDTNTDTSTGEISAAEPAPESRPKTEPLAEDRSEPASEPKPEAKAESQEAAEKSPPPPVITLNVDIDLTRQRMTVTAHGAVRHVWPISSGMQGYRTPTGVFHPQWKARMWYSRQWDYAAMPHAVFFHNGVAIHGTYATRQLGQPASHGCVRLAPSNAATLYGLVGKHGMPSTRIVVHGTPRFRGEAVARREQGYPRQRYADDRRYEPRSRQPRNGGRRTVYVYPGYGFGRYSSGYPSGYRERRASFFGIWSW